MKLDLSKYKLVYAKDGVIYGSTTGIPADSTDVVLVDSIDALAAYKLVYVNADFTAILGSTSGIPASGDTVIYSVSETTEPVDESPEEDSDETENETGDETGEGDEVIED